MKTLSIAVLLSMFLLLGIGESQDQEIAVVLKVVGMAEIKTQNADWAPLAKGHRLGSGDYIRTGEGALVSIVFTDDKSMLKIRSSSELQIEGDREPDGISKRILMTLGEVWAKINPNSSKKDLKMVTPSGVAAVRGTEFYTIVQGQERTTIVTIEGTVELFNKAGSVMVSAGKTGTAEREQAPTVSDTEEFEPWAQTDDTSQSLDIEFQDANGDKKQLELKYQE